MIAEWVVETPSPWDGESIHQEREIGRSAMDINERLQRYHQARARFRRQTSLVIMILGLVGTLASSACFVALWMWGHLVFEPLMFLLTSLALFAAGLEGFIRGKCVMNAVDEITTPL